VAAAGERLAMSIESIEGWIQRWKLVKVFYDWQILIAGVLALLAAGITVWVTLQIERGKARREVDALRKSLAVELRLHVATALVAYDVLYGLGLMQYPTITARVVERKSRMAAPIIYPANAGKIGLLGAEATDVMIVYDLLETARDGAARLMTSLATADDNPQAVVMETADAFLAACINARGLLPRLRTGDPSRDANDEALIQKINDAVAARRA
jgi:hypothetical protein